LVKLTPKYKGSSQNFEEYLELSFSQIVFKSLGLRGKLKENFAFLCNHFSSFSLVQASIFQGLSKQLHLNPETE